MSAFYRLLATTLVAVTANNFVWFALTYWAYLSTGSVIATSTMAGIFLVVSALSSIWVGTVVDRSKKKFAMLGASTVTLLLFASGLVFFNATDASAFGTVESVPFWLFITILLCGSIAGSVYNIAMPTLVGIIVPEPLRDRANGMYGTVIGVGFGITSVASGFALAYGGMAMVLRIAIIALMLAMVMLALTTVPEPPIVRPDVEPAANADLKETLRVVRSVPGLLPLIFFTTFNNFLGGVFFSLMDAYGLSLVSVETWGTLWGVLSLTMIAGGLWISKHGLGPRPLRTLFRVNIATWTACILFPVQPSIALLAAGTAVWMFLFPFAEAAEQTVLQKVVPQERLGRVFGFAHSVEQSASPLTAFLIGPLAQAVFIPYMTTGKGVAHIGSWFGTGPGRGMALVFMGAGIIGLGMTFIAMRSRAHAILAARYAETADETAVTA